MINFIHSAVVRITDQSPNVSFFAQDFPGGFKTEFATADFVLMQVVIRIVLTLVKIYNGKKLIFNRNFFELLGLITAMLNVGCNVWQTS